MKTEVRFDELPNEVQNFLNRILDPSGVRMYVPTYFIDLYWLHNLSVWKDATDEERLAYAEWKFIGMEVICLSDNDEIFVEGLDGINSSGLWGIGYKIINEEKDYGWSVLLFKKDRWAEIVGEPEKIDWSKATKDNIPVEDEPEFKAGDEVEGFGEKFSVWQSYDRNTGFIYTGGKTINNEYIVESGNGNLLSYKKIRKYEKDKHLKEIAQELIEKYVKGTACSGGGGILQPYKIHSYIFEDNGLESMLIEALKKGKSL